MMFCSTGRACLGMLLVDIIPGQRYKFREYSSSSTSSTLKYAVIVPGYRDMMNICMYLYSCSIIETPSIDSFDRVVSVADILLPYYFRLV